MVICVESSRKLQLWSFVVCGVVCAANAACRGNNVSNGLATLRMVPVFFFDG